MISSLLSGVFKDNTLTHSSLFEGKICKESYFELEFQTPYTLF